MTSSNKSPKNWSEWNNKKHFTDYSRDSGTGKFLKSVASGMEWVAITQNAGTVTSVKQAEQCIEAGAQYIVSPCLVSDLPDVCHQYDIPCFLGACTPTEMHLAMKAKADAIKIFPVSLMGGATYIKTLSSIFPGVPLIPTGGIKPNEVKEYLDNGALCVGLGGVLVNETLINRGEREMIFSTSLEILKQAKL